MAVSSFEPEPTGNILCVQCSAPIEANKLSLCANCLQAEVDVTEGIARQISVSWCERCDRYLRPPNQWVPCELESRELLGICLKKIRGLQRGDVKLVDAQFVYTAPTSRRLKVQVTIQREEAGAILQQSLTVEIVVQKMQCAECAKSFTQHTWNAAVQLRQRVQHKRTLFHLEQQILKYNAHEKVVGVKQAPDGLDFHFLQKSHAVSLNSFIAAAFPCKMKESKTLVSHDSKSNGYYFKYTLFLELCPISKDDLVRLTPEVATRCGGVPELMLCHRVGSAIECIDPMTLRTVSIHNQEFWKRPFESLANRADMYTFVVMQIDLVVDQTRRKVKVATTKARVTKRFALADVQIVRKADLGREDAELITVRSHLGNLLKEGDLCQGYDLRTINMSGGQEEDLLKGPNDVVIVKKTWERDGFKKRAWKLKRLDVEQGEEEMDEDQVAQDEEDFARELEEDEDMRKEVNLYRDPNYVAPVEAGGDDDMPEVALAELLEDMTID
jgi:nonsense-mediated mRNA decay protein 3